MNIARLLALGGIATVALLGVVLWPSAREAAPPQVVRVVETPAPVEASSAPGSIAEAEPTPVPRKVDARKRGSPLATELNAAGFDGQHDVATLHEMLRQYLRQLRGRQGRPIGNDSDLARVLTGHNPMKLVVLPATHSALSADGRLRDRWGTPYFVHPRGRGAFEIRSAGPDRKMFTADDLIQNPGGRSTDISAIPSIEEPAELEN